MRWLWLITGFSAIAFQACGAEIVQTPGPSRLLFDKPYYACVKNYFVSSTGSDSNTGTTTISPWRTLQHANDSIPGGGSAAGSCINVAPGTYSGVELTNGGDLASSTGYVVYRCASLLGCTVVGDAGVHGASAFETRWNTNGTPPNYLMIDGFVMNGRNSSPDGVGISAWNGNNGPAIASHHIWIFNNQISGFGQSGIGIAASEYYYVIHNQIILNSNLQCDSQGSGIAINIMHSVRKYRPTADDALNPNPLLGPSWIVGSSFFHNVLEWNVVSYNAITKCGTPSTPSNTDGNGIIFDSNLTSNGDSENYSSPSLVAFNLVYGNGGGGIHLFFAAYVTVANNSCYNNDMDPGNGGTGRACIDDSNGYADTFLNNIAVATPAPSGGQCWPAAPPYAKYNFAVMGAPVPGSTPRDSFSNNITKVNGRTCAGADYAVYNGDTYSCSNNLCETEPRWASVEPMPPEAITGRQTKSNFALQVSSPAIGHGLTKNFLPASSVDIGACSGAFLKCGVGVDQ